MSELAFYIEAFVEDESGFRWRVCESDPGLIHLQYQEWNSETKAFEQPEGACTEVTFGTDVAERLCDAIKLVAQRRDEPGVCGKYVIDSRDGTQCGRCGEEMEDH